MAVTSQRRRLLFLSPVMPADRGNGLAMRIGFFLDAYFREFDIDLAVIPIVSAPESGLDFVRKRVARLELFAHPQPDSHLSLVMALEDPATRLAAFRRYGRPSLAGFVHDPIRDALSARMPIVMYDFVHVSRLYMAGLVQPWLSRRVAKRPHLVIDCDEDDREAYRRIAAIEHKRGWEHRAAWAETEAEAFGKLACDLLPGFDLGFAASSAEAQSIAPRLPKVLPIPNVLPHPVLWLRRCRTTDVKTVVFVGTMGYPPNDDGVRWLLTAIWPRLRRAFDQPLRLVVVGSNPGPTIIRLGHRYDVRVTGTVADVGRFYRRADLAVVPIRAGGGTRFKLIEAAAWRVPIVSTSFGASGTTFRDGQDLLIADTADKFARSCATVLKSDALAGRLAGGARRRITQNYGHDRWVQRVLRAIDEIEHRSLAQR